ncbi:MAG: hypothetical protein KBC43_08030 [Bacteroidales bacterium]|nr:hypothetical protein [Bacteroidales bacterium]
MKNDPKLRQMIQEIIELQETIALSGGVHKKELRWLTIMEKRLFERYEIPFCDAMLGLVFDYPMSQLTDITEECNVNVCPRLQYRIMKNFIIASRKWKIPLYGLHGKTYNINMKVDCVIRNLKAIAGEYPEKY